MLADWDRKLISPERALALAGDWLVYYTVEHTSQHIGDPDVHEPDQWQLNQRCRKCGQSIALLAHGEETPFPATGTAATTPADQLSDVLRHMVTAHGQTLSGAPSE